MQARTRAEALRESPHHAEHMPSAHAITYRAHRAGSHGFAARKKLEQARSIRNHHVVGELRNNKNVLITAHGNSLRALVMHLENLSPEKIAEFNIPTGVPRKYEFSSQMKLIRVEYLGDQVAIATAVQAVVDQSNAKNQ